MMTYAEARQVMRRLYDERVASKDLHEVLEKAAEAESFLGRAAGDVAKSQEKLSHLETQYNAKLALYQGKVEAMDASLSEKRAQVKEDLAFAEDNFNKVKRGYQTEMESLAGSLVKTKESHQAELASLKREAEKARSVTASIVVEMEKVKANFKALFE